MNEKEESTVRSQAILMIQRNTGKPYIIKRVLKRFTKCIRGLS
jgi:hypothetical protein